VNRLHTAFFLLIILIASTVAVAEPATSSAGYVMRYADIGGGNIVFTYEGDLWLVADSGGDARRITSHEGNEMIAKFNQDGPG